jgi:putative serine protease PepD
MAVAVAALVLGAAAAGAAASWHAEINDAAAIASQARTIAQLQARLRLLEAGTQGQPDWSAVAVHVELSVFTISTDTGLGSGWVVRTDAGGSDIITNFHVVADAVSAGVMTVDVLQGDRTIKGTIVRVDRGDDLAVVHVADQFVALHAAAVRPSIGSTVMAVGSPLGLGGTVSIGIVSGFRSLGGSDYVQFSAPISPGNSGGPIVDRSGHVVAIATAKLVGDGVEALGFAIPVQTACAALALCVQS